MMLCRWIVPVLLAATVALAPCPALALEINVANRAQLEQLNGIGVPLAAHILDERAAHGPFRDWNDLERRVKGLKQKKLDQLGAQGMTVSGQPRGRAPQPAGTRSGAQSGTQPGTQSGTLSGTLPKTGGAGADQRQRDARRQDTDVERRIDPPAQEGMRR